MECMEVLLRVQSMEVDGDESLVALTLSAM